ncbi:NAD-dependent epimerase/dehydratase family protein [Mariprofundus ferrooxydans]|uniref:NAD-dependent epimerase/dehydratase family protein n=1 Tax=Mariprofundus ferrooxydans TaxID=314344 RepID=UPI00143091C8|nr:NAD-dependent epimerase/dehydratase family protein [Mariprofundus ferrooxydans]
MKTSASNLKNTQNQRKKILITGANGYIGKRLVIKAINAGYDINALVRNPCCFSENSRVKVFQYDFSSLLEPDSFAGVFAVVHLAATTSSLRTESDDMEVEAARQLIDYARSSGVKRIIFISSQTANLNAPTAYGRIKWKIEQATLEAKGLVVRPGQVYGGNEQGLFGLLVNFVRRSPVLPHFVPAPMVQPIHVDDLAEGLLNMVGNENLNSGVYCLGSHCPVSFSRFLSLIARCRVRSFRLFVPVPLVIVSLASTILGKTLSRKLGFDRLQSLFDLQPMETAADLERLNLSLRPIHAGMHPAGDDRRRLLLIEGNALLQYILKRKPESALLRRYVYAVEQVRDGFPLDVPSLFLKAPVLLSLLDDRSWMCESKGAELAWRFDAAVLMAEATTQGAFCFSGLERKSSPLINLVVVVRAIVSECFWRIVKVFSYPLIIRVMRKSREET